MSDTDTSLNWSSFGKKMMIIGIFVIIPIPFVGLILSILALEHIKNINYKLNNPLLESFRSKFFSTLIIKLVAAALGVVNWFFPISTMDMMNFLNNMNFAYLMPSMLISGIGVVLTIVAAAIEMGAWSSLESFFRQNATMFPANISRETEDGSHYLRNSALMYILGFLIVTLLIGWIFQIIGYFKLAKLDKISSTPMTKPTAQPSSTTPSSANVQYCPNCGADVTGAGKFCGACGSPLT